MALTLDGARDAALNNVALAGLSSSWQQLGENVVEAAYEGASSNDGGTLYETISGVAGLAITAGAALANVGERVEIFERNLVVLHGQLTEKSAKLGTPPAAWMALGVKWEGDLGETFADAFKDTVEDVATGAKKAAGAYGLALGIGLVFGLFALSRLK